MIRGYSVRLDWSEEDEAYVATCPEFPGLSGVDEDSAEALAELREAIETAIELLEEDGEHPPAPRILAEHSGQFRVRLPRRLHAALASQAETESVSLNSYVTSLLACAVGQSAAQSHVAEDLERLLTDLRSEIAAGVGQPQRRSATAFSIDEQNDQDAASAATGFFGAATIALPISRE